MPERDIPCPIWGTVAQAFGEPLGGVRVVSVRAGGQYAISEEAIADHPKLTNPQRSLLTTWLVDQRRSGVRTPLLTSQGIDEILRSAPLSFAEKKRRLFRALAGLRPGESVAFVDDFAGDLQSRRHPQRLLAEMGVVNFREGHALLMLLRDDNFLTFGGGAFHLTSKGFEYLDSLADQATSTQGFAAMWFDPQMNEAWRGGIAPAMRDAGYAPLRIDRKEHNNKIDDEIVAEIKRSRFLVADFTCGLERAKMEPAAIHRGGVYYEAGLAHGLGMPVIFTCRADLINLVHFDTRQFAHIVWQDPVDLRDKLFNRIAATIGETSGAPGRGRGFVDPRQDDPGA